MLLNSLRRRWHTPGWCLYPPRRQRCSVSSSALNEHLYVIGQNTHTSNYHSVTHIDNLHTWLKLSALCSTRFYSYWQLRRYKRKTWQQAFLQHLGSVVTRVGDTRGGNWGCHPSIFSWKTWRLFFAHRCHCHYRFLLLSLGCHTVTPSRVSPHTFLPVRPRLSTILCKFAQNFFPSGVTPWRVSPGAVRPSRSPPSDATAFRRILYME